jgi:exodeoxyribonuclease V alpha subunit
MSTLRATRARGLLQTFGAAGVLGVADVHVATRLGALAGEPAETVLLAVALLVRSTRHGSVVLDLADAAETIAADPDDAEFDGADFDRADFDRAEGAEPAGIAPAELPWPAVDDWVAACAASPLLADSEGGAPLRRRGSRVWLDRYWRQEALVADELLRRSADRPSDLEPDALRADLDELFATDADADQKLATCIAALSRVSVIAGGPGTGKTTTIARLITVLRRQQPALRIALAAPTGKAAARLEEAIRSAQGAFTDADRMTLTSLSAATLHRLLGRRPGVASRFRHDRDNRLPFDVVIVDECSMVSLTLMARLLEALAPATRLVLVGDPDQLASVEAGAVLGDLVDPDDVGPVTAGFGAVLQPVLGAQPSLRRDAPHAALRESVALLRTGRRFAAGSPIDELAEHVRAGRADAALEMLHARHDAIVFHASADDAPLPPPALAALQAQLLHETDGIAAARQGDIGAALDCLDRHRLLCAHRAGPRGVRHWSDAVERWLAATDPTLAPRLDGHYAGQPLLVTSNDYENALYNGDSGIVVQIGDELAAAFRRGGAPVVLPLVRLSEVRPLHAMTVHRAQGSQFDEVTVLLPFADSRLATRQTFYTAITRATTRVRLIGSVDAVRACIERRAARATGLRDRIDAAG